MRDGVGCEELDVVQFQAVRILLVVISVLFAFIVGLVVGFMAKLNGASAVSALVKGGSAFGAAVPVILLIMSAAGLLDQSNSTS
jgi:ABC-type dipeptide/oligopeptide/nickel transport system permease component